jgi:uncharacterized protein
MKFQPDQLAGTNVLTRVEPDRVWVGALEYGHSVIVPWTGPVQRWAPVTFEQLQPEHFEAVTRLDAAVVIFGSGARLRFPPAAMLRSLIQRGVGVETMDTPAACRTYNVLAAEGRQVVAALLMPEPADR